MDASKILDLSIKTLGERGVDYDHPVFGERSMPAIVALFNRLTEHNLSVKDGYEFMVLLKLVRSRQGKDKLDNYVDAAAYVALAGECLAGVE